MKTALVTGANRGIGFELAKDFLKNNINFNLATRTPENVQATIDKLSDINTLANASGIVIDLNDKNTIQAAKHQFENNDLSLDYLINNAGIAGDMSHGALKTTESDIKKTLDVNLFGTMEIINLITNHEDYNGDIINNTGQILVELK